MYYYSYYGFIILLYSKILLIYKAQYILNLFIDTSNNTRSGLKKKSLPNGNATNEPLLQSRRLHPKTRQVINKPETIDTSHKNSYLTSKLLQVSFSNKPPPRQMSLQQQQQQIIHQIKEFSKQTQNTKAFDTSIRCLKKRRDRFHTQTVPYVNILRGDFVMASRAFDARQISIAVIAGACAAFVPECLFSRTLL